MATTNQCFGLVGLFGESLVLLELPLFKLEEKGSKFVGSSKCQESLEKLKKAQCEAGALAYRCTAKPAIPVA